MKACPLLLQALANTVEKLRKERKLTKTALAGFADLQDCYIRGITKGRRNPTVAAVYSICEALEVPVSQFFTLVEEERKRLSGEQGQP
ncbi:MAG: helix-turn-helix transcriptional regulator [Desulfovibrio sp.]|nr:helix-turn-helix transcriptional regulator [Desulfovibrio sp.]